MLVFSQIILPFAFKDLLFLLLHLFLFSFYRHLTTASILLISVQYLNLPHHFCMALFFIYSLHYTSELPVETLYICLHENLVFLR